jgi:hypothetical protein
LAQFTSLKSDYVILWPQMETNINYKFNMPTGLWKISQNRQQLGPKNLLSLNLDLNICQVTKHVNVTYVTHFVTVIELDYLGLDYFRPVATLS